MKPATTHVHDPRDTGWKIDRVLIDRPRLRLRYTRRGRDAFMGRFGGGWQWAVGFEAGARRTGRQTIILNLLVAMLRIEINPSRRA